MKFKQTGRYILLTICVLQMISTGERQLFDFLGRMWLPILCNFFNFILVIFGFFGAYQYKQKYIIIYLTWMLIWLGWNVFIICFYLDVGSLSNHSDWLNFGTGSASWWEVNGIGCDPVYPTNLTQVDVSRPLRPEKVNGCILDYEYVETIHAAFQCCFAVPGVIVSIYLIKKFSDQDDSCKKKPTSIYYVEYSSPREGSESPDLVLDDASAHQQPMTPRKVKRQSRHRSSGRSSQRPRRPQYLNPVTQLIDKANESSTSTDSYRAGPPLRPPFAGRQGHSNPMYVHSRPNSITDPVERPPSVHSSYSNYHGQRPSLNPNGVLYRQSGSHRRPPVAQGRSTFRPASSPHFGTLKGSDTFSEDRPPPPYMFGVNSETVI